MEKRLTYSEVNLLKDLAAGGKLKDDPLGDKRFVIVQMQGSSILLAARVVKALREKGLIDGYKLTPSGKKVVREFSKG